jgi:hypothetical protein
MIWKDKQDVLQAQGNLCDEHAKAYEQLAHGLHQQNRMTNNYCIQSEHATAQKIHFLNLLVPTILNTLSFYHHVVAK